MKPYFHLKLLFCLECCFHSKSHVKEFSGTMAAGKKFFLTFTVDLCYFLEFF